MYIAGSPAVRGESRNVYHWCAHGRIRVKECILLVRPLYNTRPRMCIAGEPTVEKESRNVYCQHACCRI